MWYKSQWEQVRLLTENWNQMKCQFNVVSILTYRGTIQLSPSRDNALRKSPMHANDARAAKADCARPHQTFGLRKLFQSFYLEGCHQKEVRFIIQEKWVTLKDSHLMFPWKHKHGCFRLHTASEHLCILNGGHALFQHIIWITKESCWECHWLGQFLLTLILWWVNLLHNCPDAHSNQVFRYSSFHFFHTWTRGKLYIRGLLEGKTILFRKKERTKWHSCKWVFMYDINDWKAINTVAWQILKY